MRSASGSPGRVLRDEGEDTRLRLKAAEIIALHGMPKGDTARRAVDGISSLRVEFVRADGSIVTFGDKMPQPNGPGIIEVPFAEVDESDEN